MAGGSLLNWAILREGTVTTWLRADIKTLLSPLVLRKKGVSKWDRPSSPVVCWDGLAAREIS
jgi:hypothetical protein